MGICRSSKTGIIYKKVNLGPSDKSLAIKQLKLLNLDGPSDLLIKIEKKYYCSTFRVSPSVTPYETVRSFSLISAC